MQTNPFEITPIRPASGKKFIDRDEAREARAASMNIQRLVKSAEKGDFVETEKLLAQIGLDNEAWIANPELAAALDLALKNAYAKDDRQAIDNLEKVYFRGDPPSRDFIVSDLRRVLEQDGQLFGLNLDAEPFTAEEVRKLDGAGDAYRRLSTLINLPLENILDYALQRFDGRALDYLKTRIEKYRGLSVEGDGVQGDASTYRKGLFRDSIFASMIGSPELAIFRSARRYPEAVKTHMPAILGFESGIEEFNSHNRPNDTPHGYQELHKAYEGAEAEILRRTRGIRLEPAVLRHRAINLAADWVARASGFNRPDRSPTSSYSQGFPVAFAWARLGEDVQRQMLGMHRKVKDVTFSGIDRFVGKSADSRRPDLRRRLDYLKFEESLVNGIDKWIDVYSEEANDEVPVARHLSLDGAAAELLFEAEGKRDSAVKRGMYAKIMARGLGLEYVPGSPPTGNLYSTDYFLQKVKEGVAKALEDEDVVSSLANSEMLFFAIKELKGDATAKRLRANKDNPSQPVSSLLDADVLVLKSLMDSELEQLKWEFKAKTAALKPGDKDGLSKARLEHKMRVEGLKTKPREFLRASLAERRLKTQREFDRGKSLAQKALDLHWTFARRGDWTSGSVDWINRAGFGNISRCHRLLTEGEDPEKVNAYALACELFGRADFSPAFLETWNNIAKLLDVRVVYSERAENRELFGHSDNPHQALGIYLRKMYPTLLRNGLMSELKSIVEASGVAVDPEDGEFLEAVKDRTISDFAYGVARCYGDVGDLLAKYAEFKKFLGYDPIRRFPAAQEAVIGEFRKMLSHANDDGCSVLERIAQMNLDARNYPEEVQKGYAELVKSPGGPNKYEMKLSAFEDKTGCPPVWQEQPLKGSVVKKYFELVWMDKIGSLKELIKISGIEPGILAEDADSWRTFAEVSEADKMRDTVGRVAELCQVDREKVTETMRRGIKMATGRLLSSGRYATLLEYARKEKIYPESDELREAFLRQLEAGEPSEALIELLMRSNAKLDMGLEELDKFRIDSPFMAAMVHKLCLPKDKAMREQALRRLGGRGGWMGVVPRLMELKGPSLRAEFCPWRTGLDPLVSALGPEAFRSPARQQGLVEFVEKFGMINVPRLASVTLDLVEMRSLLEQGYKPAEARTSLRPGTAALLAQFARVHKVDLNLDRISKPQDIENIFGILKGCMERLKLSILDDFLPEGLESSPLDMDLFNAIVPAGKTWGHPEDRQKLIASWRNTVAANAGRVGGVRVSVPREYGLAVVDRTYAIKPHPAAMSFDDWLKSLNEGAGDQAVTDAILALEKKLKEAMNWPDAVNFLEPLRLGLQSADSIRVGAFEPNEFFKPLHERAAREVEKLEKELGALAETPENERKRKGLTLNLQKAQAKRDMALALRQNLDISALLDMHARSAQEAGDAAVAKRFSDLAAACTDESRKAYAYPQALLEVLAANFGDKMLQEAREESYMLMTRLMTLESPGHARAARESEAVSRAGDSSASVRAWSAWFKEELIQHFASDVGAHQNIRGIPFCKTAKKTIDKMLGLGNVPDEVRLSLFTEKESAKRAKHPLAQVGVKADGIEKSIQDLRRSRAEAVAESLQKSVTGGPEVVFSPCHGLGRIMAGDIGDACYSSYRDELALGQFPDIDSILISNKAENRSEARLLGSILLIRAKTQDGRSCLTLRALNPIDSVVQRELDAESLVEAIIDYAVKLAKASGVDQVNLCLGRAATGSGSNRTPVYDAMKKLATEKHWSISQKLQVTSETSFKYEVWDTDSEQVFRVWSRP